MKKVLVVGSEGFVGKSIVSKLIQEKFTVIGIDLAATGSSSYAYHKVKGIGPEVAALFNKEKFDYCINAAGSGSVPLSINEPQLDFDANVSDTLQVLDYIRIANPSCKYLHISSAAVYGNPVSLPITEDMPLTPLSPYGYHKWMSELLCKEFTAVFGLSTLIVRPFSVYGPGLRKQLIWDLYQKIHTGKEVVLHGTGNESRDFIYIDDLATALLTIMQQATFNGDAINIASGVETTIREIATLFQSIIANECVIQFNNQQRAGDPANWRADTGKLQELGFACNFSIHDGLTATCKWLQQNA